MKNLWMEVACVSEIDGYGRFSFKNLKLGKYSWKFIKAIKSYLLNSLAIHRS